MIESSCEAWVMVWLSGLILSQINRAPRALWF
jgi:hypothetical protein